MDAKEFYIYVGEANTFLRFLFVLPSVFQLLLPFFWSCHLESD